MKELVKELNIINNFVYRDEIDFRGVRGHIVDKIAFEAGDNSLFCFIKINKRFNVHLDIFFEEDIAVKTVMNVYEEKSDGSKEHILGVSGTTKDCLKSVDRLPMYGPPIKS